MSPHLPPGIAYSGTIGPPVIYLTMYFEKRRALATGLAFTGASIGQLVIPFLITWLIGTYSFQGGILIYSGLVMNLIPAALLLRPLTFWLTSKQKKALAASPQAKAPFCTKFKVALGKVIDKELLTSPLFYHYLGALIVTHLGYWSCLVFIPKMGVEVFGSKSMATLLVSVIGICDLVGRLLGGYIADLKVIPIYTLMGISVGVPGIVVIVTALVPVTATVWMSAVLLGALAGSYIALLPPSCVELFGAEKVPAGFGSAAFLMGALMIPAPIIMGEYLREAILVEG